MIRRLAVSVSVSVAALIAYCVPVVCENFLLAQFAPSGDAGFGFGLGMIPSLVLELLCFIGILVWVIVSSWFSQRRPLIAFNFYSYRAFFVGLIAAIFGLCNGNLLYVGFLYNTSTLQGIFGLIQVLIFGLVAYLVYRRMSKPLGSPVDHSEDSQTRRLAWWF